MRWKLFICLALTVATLMVYWPVGSHEFINYDDAQYVTDNSHVTTGLTRDNIVWAFTATHEANWHPLTWLSHMADCELYGLNPTGHHLTSLFLHLLNALLLFLLLTRMTGALWRSAFVAALFALHPLHVESVAWVAERKDVLSALFWMLTLLAYTGYVARPARWKYLLALCAFAFGLMAKPMLVTLPFVLLLLDYWPLGRIRNGKAAEIPPQAGSARIYFIQTKSIPRLIWEKVPFIVLSVVSSVITIIAQHKDGAVASTIELSLPRRVGNALVSYADYIGKMIWPHRLAVFYPFPLSLPLWKVAGSTVLLVGLSITVFRARRRAPWFMVGWLWFVGTLVPVIGLVQVGFQSMADRYTYLPLIGLFIVIAWGFPDLLRGWRHQHIALVLSAVLVLSGLASYTRRQLDNWKDSVTLFTHALQVTSSNFTAQYNLGSALERLGKYNEAVPHLTMAIRLRPDVAGTYYILGNVLYYQGKLDEAVSHYQWAIRIKPSYGYAHNNLGVALVRQGKLEEAINHYAEALRINPSDAEARQNLNNCLKEIIGVMEIIGVIIGVKPTQLTKHLLYDKVLPKLGKAKENEDGQTAANRISGCLLSCHFKRERAQRRIQKPERPRAVFVVP
jgi:protein O-mannosyl-transferase